jgi:hypothetical protein
MLHHLAFESPVKIFLELFRFGCHAAGRIGLDDISIDAVHLIHRPLPIISISDPFVEIVTFGQGMDIVHIKVVAFVIFCLIDWTYQQFVCKVQVGGHFVELIERANRLFFGLTQSNRKYQTQE